LLPTIRSRVVDLRFAPLSRVQVREILIHLHYGHDDAELGASLSAGSVTRARAALEGEEESLRGQVIRWFFQSVAGTSPQDSWATRETLDEGLETLKTLVRDWIVAGLSPELAPFTVDHAERLRRLRPLDQRAAVGILGKIDEAQRLARSNVRPEFVAELVRMALTSTP